ncbi:MAG: methyltransferase domain-containing protein [Bacteroidetes bacterium]|nr:methyltransferase domain-containing protein [Bacteroidota bacterium]
MKNKDDFNQISYQTHEKHFCDYARGGKKAKHAKTWFEDDTVDAWRHKRIYKSLDPLLKAFPHASWLTVGDGRFGNDAHYIQERGLKVLATDISDVLLKEAKEIGYIDDYSKENAEALSFSDEEYDFVFCKESYHHFPRPMIALYEMLRVAKTGIVLIEPNDGYVASTFLDVLFTNFKDFIKNILYKNNIKHGFEQTGNYIYSISKREIEKVALGMNFKAVAFKGIDDYYVEGVEYEKATKNSKLFKQVKIVIGLFDLLTKLKLKQSGLLTAIIFKEELQPHLKENLLSDGYGVIVLPENPYL